MNVNEPWQDRILEDGTTREVRFVRLEFTDLFGVVKSVEVPEIQLNKAPENALLLRVHQWKGIGSKTTLNQSFSLEAERRLSAPIRQNLLDMSDEERERD